jgi:hypothetical protein
VQTLLCAIATAAVAALVDLLVKELVGTLRGRRSPA